MWSVKGEGLRDGKNRVKTHNCGNRRLAVLEQIAEKAVKPAFGLRFIPLSTACYG
jgi:hypothetical protein